jgi:hypothetical protein
MVGVELKLDVTAVSVCPNTALPVMETVPAKVARLTVTVTSFVKGVVGLAPFTMVALMVAVPAAVVLRILPPVMVAPVVPAFCTLHTMVLLVAVVGTTVPVSVSGEVTVAVVGMPVMSVTATKGDAESNN